MTKEDLGGRLAWASNHISTSLHYFTTLDPATPPPLIPPHPISMGIIVSGANILMSIR